MSIRRAKRQNNFTIINNQVFQNGLLSWRAMGLLAYILSKPDDWTILPQALIKVTEGTARNDRKNTVYEILKELKEVGFVTMRKLADGTVEYTVHDEPQDGEKPVPKNQEQVNNQLDSNNKKPVPKKPVPKKPDQEKPDQAFWDVILNTERQPRTDLPTRTDTNQPIPTEDAGTPTPAGQQPPPNSQTEGSGTGTPAAGWLVGISFPGLGKEDQAASLEVLGGMTEADGLVVTDAFRFKLGQGNVSNPIGLLRSMISKWKQGDRANIQSNARAWVGRQAKQEVAEARKQGVQANTLKNDILADQRLLEANGDYDAGNPFFAGWQRKVREWEQLTGQVWNVQREMAA